MLTAPCGSLWELAPRVLCLLGEETEALCGYSWETLRGVRPALMGNEVTQPPGIPPIQSPHLGS